MGETSGKAASGDEVTNRIRGQPMTTQKQIWADKAAKRRVWAASAQAKAETIFAARSTDFALISQPGHIPARAAETKRHERACELLNSAKAHSQKAANLEALATRQAGDAERAREAIRAACEWAVGDMAKSVHYGVLEVVRVNKKTLTLKGAFGNLTTDKAWCRKVVK